MIRNSTSLHVHLLAPGDIIHSSLWFRLLMQNANSVVTMDNPLSIASHPVWQPVSYLLHIVAIYQYLG